MNNYAFVQIANNLALIGKSFPKTNLIFAKIVIHQLKQNPFLAPLLLFRWQLVPPPYFCMQKQGLIYLLVLG